MVDQRYQVVREVIDSGDSITEIGVRFETAFYEVCSRTSMLT